MPTLNILPAQDAADPAPEVAAEAVQQQEPLPYESFVKEVGAFNVGELRLSAQDDMKAIKVALRQAANRLGVEIDIWDVSGNVYFRNPEARAKRRISRPA